MIEADRSNCRKKEKITAVIITYNEENRLDKCLDSVKWMDEIIIVDSDSTDKTRNVARKFTDHVYYRRFDDYATQKNFGAEKANNEWIFSIDADEVMTPELKDEIIKILGNSMPYDGYAVYRENIYFGCPIRFVFGKDRPIRLYKRGKSRFEGSVHEKVTGGDIGQLTSKLYHYSCNTYREWVQKHRKYICLEAVKQAKQGSRFSLSRCFFSPMRVFILRYIIFRGWRDGWAGLAIAFEMSKSTILYQFQLRKLSKSQNKEL